MKFLLLILFLSFVFTQVTPYCANDNQCNNYSTKYGQTCLVSSGTCTAKTTIPFKGTKTSQSQACSDSLNFGLQCGALAGDNCAVTLSDNILKNYVCTGIWRGVSSTCVPIVNTDKLSTVNARCDYTASPRQTCPLGTSCISNVCRVLQTTGGFCVNNADCITGLCDYRKCSLPRSLYDFQNCENGASCISGVCNVGICSAVSSNTCYTNDDCVGYGVCLLPTGSTTDSTGTCYSNSAQTTYNLNYCYYNKCQSIYGTTISDCINSNCTNEYIANVCASTCLLGKENRYSTEYGQFVYDCYANTRTAWATGSNCQIQQDGQIKNCPL